MNARILTALVLLWAPAATRAGDPSPFEEPSPPVEAAEAELDFEALIERVRENAWRSKKAVFDYSFVQHERSLIKKRNGQVVHRHDRKFRVVPVRGGLVRELLAVDGREPTAKELRRNEKQNRKGLRQRRAEIGSEEEEAERYVEGMTRLIELLSQAEHELVGRRELGGRELLGVAFHPSVLKGEKGLTKKVLKHAQGTIWLDGATGEPVVMEMGNSDSFRVRAVLGIKDVSFRMTQVRVHDELWLPSRIEVDSLVSFMGVKRRFESVTEFTEHRKAVVTVDEEQHGPIDAAVPAEPPNEPPPAGEGEGARGAAPSSAAPLDRGLAGARAALR